MRREEDVNETPFLERPMTKAFMLGMVAGLLLGFLTSYLGWIAGEYVWLLTNM